MDRRKDNAFVSIAATKTQRYKEKTDINKIIIRWPGFLNNINAPNIKQYYQCNNSIIFVA